MKARVESELDDFYTECRAYRIEPKEFTLQEHNYVETPMNDVISSPNAKITITRKNISRTYPTGNATHWVADFSNDLRAGVFD